ncbi:hypothetical protein HLB44_34575 [Aquincola sp. S2]|uniref:Uncharacterized protein n=1 Tax=Pseudaquabacterium terrae TaxID=2732868 RepID=A0ABX2ETP4_9BURK|nr:hypothetical protein [Aquabacterium terrae]NRF72122.1 hypothetical protein [Aquabacterium terrae]
MTAAQMRRAALATVLLSALSAQAGYLRVTLSDNNTRLTLTKTGGVNVLAPAFAEQVGFSEVKLSADGKHVGWLALFPNCCTSYPIALKLVVLDDAGRLHTFDGEKLAIFDWCFVPTRRAVAFRQGVLHGTDAQHFELRRIEDDHRMAQYDYPHDEQRQAHARSRAPRWLRCVPE